MPAAVTLVIGSSSIQGPVIKCDVGVMPVSLFTFVASNNLRFAAILALGGFLLGLPTIAALVLNGATFGSLSAQLIGNPTFLIEGTLPHGLLEIAGYIFSASVGLHFARIELNMIRGRETNLNTTPVVVSVSIAIALILGAAAVEALVTPTLVNSFCP